MTEKQTTKASKFLSLILRHKPQVARLELDDSGWVKVEKLLEGCTLAGRHLTLDQLKHIVATNAKKRFEFSEDKKRIRASQGHSIPIELEYTSTDPPEVLYHGTATRFLESIRKKGLLKMQRHQVHLSAETRITMEVGARHGNPVLLSIRAGEMHRSGYEFFCSTNGVWLVDHAPTDFIDFPR